MVYHRARLRRTGLLVLALVIATVALAACGDDEDTPDAAASTATAAATSVAEMTATPTMASGGTLTISVETGAAGPYLAGPDGRTLYVFTKDEPGKTNCSGQCLANWPPLLQEDGQEVEAAAEATLQFGAIDTPSGQQVTYNDAPLYYFAGDAAPSETKGHLVGGVWFLARPDTASTYIVGVRDDGSPKTPYLVGPTGMTLYTFANDTEGTSNCSGQCLENWPALLVPEGQDPTAADAADGTLDVFVRDDGTRQVTYDGLPLYYFARDTAPGDITGDGVGGVWDLATP